MGGEHDKLGGGGTGLYLFQGKFLTMARNR